MQYYLREEDSRVSRKNIKGFNSSNRRLYPIAKPFTLLTVEKTKKNNL